MSVVLKCKNCGADLLEEKKFCANCGSLVETQAEAQAEPAAEVVVVEPVTEPEVIAEVEVEATIEPEVVVEVTAEIEVKSEETVPAEQPEIKKAANKKKMLIPIVGVLAVLLVALIAIVAVFVMKPVKYEESKASLYVEQFDDKVTILNGKVKLTVNGSLLNHETSLDGTKAAILVSDDDESILYYFDGKTAKKVSDGVDFGCMLAAGGKGIIYFKNYENETDSAELYYYYGDKSQRITSEMSGAACISPNGKTVSYAVKKDDYYNSYIWENGKIKDLDGRDKMPIAISNGGKYVYFTKNEAVYVQKGVKDDSKNKVADGYIGTLFFNKDLSQVIVSISDRAYISIKGGERESLSTSSTYLGNFILPEGTASKWTYFGVVYGIDSFANTFYRADNNDVLYLDKKFKSESVVKSVSDVYIANDGKTLVYLKNRSIYKIDGTKTDSSSDSVELGRTDDNIESFKMLKNGSVIYYVNSDDEMYYQKGTGKPVRIAYGISSYSILQKSKKVLYVSDKELYSSSGKKGTKIKGVGDNVQYVWSYRDFIITSTKDGTETIEFLSKNGSKFERIGSNQEADYNNDYDGYDDDDWDW